MAASHQINLDDLRSRINTLESENPTKLANIFLIVYPHNILNPAQKVLKLNKNSEITFKDGDAHTIQIGNEIIKSNMGSVQLSDFKKSAISR